MTTIALHQYLQKIEEFIDDRLFDEAIVHCRHILEQYPRHVDTYRTLAKVYVEKGDYDAVVDLTQRVLSTNPADLIAHVALSVAFREQGELDRAVYHLQRALDVEPYNSALREELNEIYLLKEVVPPQSIAPSAAALARMYLKSEMYHMAIAELRRVLAENPERIDLKVLLAETLWWANERVDAVSLSLEILDQLPNCIPANAILAEIWLQTGRIAEAQTYLKRLQSLLQWDKAHCDAETAVGRAFLTRGAFPLPDEVTVEQYGEEALLEPDAAEEMIVTAVDSGWIEEFGMSETDDLPEGEADSQPSDWLIEAAHATGDNFGTQPLVMPSDPLEAETDWFADSGVDEDESLDGLIDDTGDGAELAEWLTSTFETREPEMLESTGFTGMLSGLLDSELEVEDETAVSPDMDDLFAELDEPQAEDAAMVGDTAVAAGLTDLFDEISEPSVREAADAPAEDLDLDLFLDSSFPAAADEDMGGADDSFAAGLTALFSDMEDAEPDDAADFSIEEPDFDEFPVTDLADLTEAAEPEVEDDRTGYTELFDQLSTDAFPDEPETLDSDWLLRDTDESALNLTDLPDQDEAMPDWLTGAGDAAAEPAAAADEILLDDLVDSEVPLDFDSESDWLTALADSEPGMEEAEVGDDWLAEWADDEPVTAVPDSQPRTSDILSDESVAPIDMEESFGFDTDELEDETAVPTWLLGGDKTVEETGTFGESEPLDEMTLPDGPTYINPQKLLAGDELPDWLSADLPEQEPETETSDPLGTDSMAALAGEEFPSWLSDEEPDLAAKPIPEPDSEFDLFQDDVNIPDWLGVDLVEEESKAETSDPLGTDSMAELAGEEFPSWLVDDEPDVKARPIPEPDSEFDRYKDDVNIPDWLMADFSTGQDQAEVPVTDEQELTPEQEPEASADDTPETSDDDGLSWLEELDEPAESLSEKDDSASFASRVAAGEGPAVEEPPTQVSMPDELPDAGFDTSDLQWLDELSENLDTDAVEDQVTLDWSQTESDMDDVLAGVTGELNADLEWLDSLAEETDSESERIDGVVEDFDSGTGLLGDLSGDAGEILGEEPVLPDFEDSLAILPDEPDDDLDWLAELDDDLAGDLLEEEIEAVESLVEETAVTADEFLEPEMFDAGEPPEELEDAMAWLENLAAGQGAKLEELPSMADILEDEPSEEALPELADESLDWLEDLPIEDEIDGIEPVSGLETDYSGAPELEDMGDAPPLDDLADMEDAMAWLEGLAAKQGADLEELPSMAGKSFPEPAASEPTEQPEESLDWLEDLAGDAVDDAAILTEFDLDEDMEPVEASLDWLEDVAEPEAVAEAAEEPELVDEVSEAEAVPDNLDEAMVWLEALAVEQGAKLEELPSLAKPAEEVEEMAEIEETAVAPSAEPELADDETPADLDEAMGWLEDLAAEQATPLEDLPTIAGVIDEMPVQDLEESAAPPEPDDELAEALDWLEQMALEEGAPLADVPAAETAVPVATDELNEALDWLEHLAQSGEPAEEAVDELADLSDLSAEMPEDPDEALAWLQQIAAEQEPDESDLIDDIVFEPVEIEPTEIELEPVAAEDEAVAEEAEAELDLVTAVEELAEPEIEDDVLAEMPDDPDAAMAWLEQLAARQGAKLEELPSVSADDMPDLVEEPISEEETVDDLVELLDEAAPVTELDLPVFDDAVEDALDWLEVDEETAVAEPELEELDEAGLPEADLADLEVPEDEDDAMAWLEALAAQQGARLEELPTLSGTGELSPDVLDEIDAGETAVTADEEPAAEIDIDAGGEMLGDETLLDVDSDLLSDIEDAIPDWLTADTGPLAGETPAAAAEDADFLEDVDEALPDWLNADTDSLEQMPGQTQWLKALDEPDIDGWLDEEESTISSSYDRTIQSRFETQPEAAFETGPLSMPEEEIDTDLFGDDEDEFGSNVFSLDDEKLDVARQAVSQGVFGDALQVYQELVDAGGGMMTLIADLETVITDHPEEPTFQHLLGDAYMRNGQLQKALDTYRMALDQI